MNGKIIISHIKTHFDLSLSMLKKEIDACPDDLWERKAGGFVFFQQVAHAFAGLEFWTRSANGEFAEPFAERKIYPELDGVPVGKVSKAEMREYVERVSAQVNLLFEGKDDAWLSMPSVIYGKILNLDVIEMQIRHMQYHTGHCNSILRERGLKAVDWEDCFN